VERTDALITSFDVIRYPFDHPFATALQGSDNIISFTTKRFVTSALVGYLFLSGTVLIEPLHLSLFPCTQRPLTPKRPPRTAEQVLTPTPDHSRFRRGGGCDGDGSHRESLSSLAPFRASRPKSFFGNTSRADGRLGAALLALLVLVERHDQDLREDQGQDLGERWFLRAVSVGMSLDGMSLDEMR
jgi:hypothetical protein